MNQIKLKEILKEKYITVPLYFLKRCPELKLSSDELILLLYLYDKDKIVFNPEIISSDLEMDITKVMELISNLNDKGLILLETMKNEKNIMEEVINLAPLFEMLTIKVMEELTEEEDSTSNIYDLIEEEFGRNREEGWIYLIRAHFHKELN